ncbi:olfactory receptor 226-like [Pantherophis guttatus]|uniref:Olfactory receptor 226-like n=1 Tax=Pantherophis guttatus TaxID=94885 RepID=A0ABM3ZMN0_PANGU|nr:olfactory receptor 226-like [Pantherophis guttatus]
MRHGIEQPNQSPDIYPPGFSHSSRTSEIAICSISLYLYPHSCGEHHDHHPHQDKYSLQKPMYLFLSHLSFLETWYISVTVPKLLINFLATDKSISYAGCMAQLYFFLSLACTECGLLAVMAYDRYVAICHPLRYPVIMTSQLCLQLAVGSWLTGFLISMLKVFFISRLSFCGPNVINHFFCDISPLLNLSCTDRTVAEMVDFVFALLILLIPLSVTMGSYAFIIGTILRIPTRQGKSKAFSTCASPPHSGYYILLSCSLHVCKT